MCKTRIPDQSLPLYAQEQVGALSTSSSATRASSRAADLAGDPAAASAASGPRTPAVALGVPGASTKPSPSPAALPFSAGSPARTHSRIKLSRHSFFPKKMKWPPSRHQTCSACMHHPVEHRCTPVQHNQRKLIAINAVACTYFGCVPDIPMLDQRTYAESRVAGKPTGSRCMCLGQLSLQTSATFPHHIQICSSRRGSCGLLAKLRPHGRQLLCHLHSMNLHLANRSTNTTIS